MEGLNLLLAAAAFFIGAEGVIRLAKAFRPHKKDAEQPNGKPEFLRQLDAFYRYEGERNERK